MVLGSISPALTIFGEMELYNSQLITNFVKLLNGQLP